jgi:hypothetical protein
MDRPAGASALQPLRGVTLFFGAHPDKPGLQHSVPGGGCCTRDKFTVADAYLFTVLRWTSRIDIDLAKCFPGTVSGFLAGGIGVEKSSQKGPVFCLRTPVDAAQQVVKPRHRAGRLLGAGFANSWRSTGPAVEQLPTPTSSPVTSFRPRVQQLPRPPFVGVPWRTEQYRVQPPLRRRPLP